MLKSNRANRSTFPATVFLIILATFILSACAGGEVKAAIGPAGLSLSPSAIVFVGKVTDPNTGTWLNDYTVIVYLNGEEIGRTVSKRDEYVHTGQGVFDGMFVVYVENHYKLTVEDEFVDLDTRQSLEMSSPDNNSSSRYIYRWFGEKKPDELIRIGVPAKQIEYDIVVMPVSNAELPEAFLNGPTTIDGNGGVRVPLDTDGQVIVVGANGSNAGKGGGFQKLEGQKSEKNVGSVIWERQLTHFYGNRWQAWQLYVAGQVPGMTWEQFKDGVVQHNQHLMQTGYVFQYDQVYLLPVVSSN